jgi:hypothetical protein
MLARLRPFGVLIHCVFTGTPAIGSPVSSASAHQWDGCGVHFRARSMVTV